MLFNTPYNKKYYSISDTFKKKFRFFADFGLFV